MQVTPHVEQHFSAAEAVRDVVIGMSDGLTVPFALAAGLAGALDATRVVVVAGLAEIAAGSIAMGLGGYLAGRTDAEHYASEQRRELQEVETVPEREREEVAGIFRDLGLRPWLVPLDRDGTKIASETTAAGATPGRPRGVRVTTIRDSCTSPESRGRGAGPP